MKTLVFNSKGGSGKSLIAREIIAAPKAIETVIIEIDALNRTQQNYLSQFKLVIELETNKVKDLIIPLVRFNNCVIDVGTNNSTTVISVMNNYDLFKNINNIVIPLGVGRSDSENALKTYAALKGRCSDIKFAFTNFNQNENFEDQYKVFFDNINDYIKNFNENQYVKIPFSEVFLEAQYKKLLVTELAKEVDYSSEGILAIKSGDDKRFEELMQKELAKRAAQVLIKNIIMPANKKLMNNE